MSTMFSRGRFAAAGFMLLAGTVAASAQTTIITTQPQVAPQVTTGAAVVTTTRPLELTPVQRQSAYRTIIRERSVPAQATVEYRVGARVPEATTLYTMPQEVAVEVPSIQTYKYMVVNNRVLLVDPSTSQVVGELAE